MLEVTALCISIHALLAESDILKEHTDCGRIYCYFYPRSPCGERPFSLLCRILFRRYFYPKSPCGERRKVPILG